MQEKLSRPRPLSPHIGIYRWQISMITSILHRASGLMLSLSAVVIALWFYTAAYAPYSYVQMAEIFRSIPGKIALILWSLAFYYHLLNGIRHLAWDAGYGFSVPTAERTGQIALAGSVLLAVITAYCLFFHV